MIKRLLFTLGLIAACCALAVSGENNGDAGPNTRQYYSGKVGFYAPGDGLNNGLLLGIDGITEFRRFNLFLSAAADAYLKQSIDIFRNPQPGGGKPPDVSSQQMVLLPLHVDAGYKLFEIPDADSRLYAGMGGGYYLYFYSVSYRSPGGLLGGSITPTSDSKSGGAFFGSVYTRLMIGGVFVEPRYYLASRSEDATGGYSFSVDPTGFAVTLGFQFH